MKVTPCRMRSSPWGPRGRAGLLRRRARGARRPSVPAFHVGEFFRQLKFRDFHEIDRDLRGDVGDGEICHPRRRAGSSARRRGIAGIRRRAACWPRPSPATCGLTSGFMKGCRCWNTRRHRAQQIEFGAPVPHLDQRALQRAAAEQRRIGMQRLEIAADGDRFGDHRAVVENQRRQPLHRVDRGIGLACGAAACRCRPARSER